MLSARTITHGLSRLTMYVLLLLFAAFSAMPIILMFSTAIKLPNEVYAWPPIIIPAEPQWQNFSKAWSAAPFTRFLFNTVYITLAHMLFALFSSSTAGYAFAKFNFVGKKVLFYALLMLLMLPGQVTLVPSFLIVRNLHWLNSYAGLIVPGLVSVFGIFLLRQYMQTIPNALIDAARIDGAHDWYIYRAIILPLTTPALATLAIFSFTASWNSFMWPLIVADRTQYYTLQVGIAFFVTEAGTNYTHMMAICALSLLPVIAVYVLFQKYFVRGVAMSGMKG